MIILAVLGGGAKIKKAIKDMSYEKSFHSILRPQLEEVIIQVPNYDLNVNIMK